VEAVCWRSRSSKTASLCSIAKDPVKHALLLIGFCFCSRECAVLLFHSKLFFLFLRGRLRRDETSAVRLSPFIHADDPSFLFVDSMFSSSLLLVLLLLIVPFSIAFTANMMTDENSERLARWKDRVRTFFSELFSLVSLIVRKTLLFLDNI